jgi:hypothetical protein
MLLVKVALFFVIVQRCWVVMVVVVVIQTRIWVEH